MLSNLPHEARYILSYETGKDAYRRINYIQDKLAPSPPPPTNDMRGIPSPLGGCPTKTLADPSLFFKLRYHKNSPFWVCRVTSELGTRL